MNAPKQPSPAEMTAQQSQVNAAQAAANQAFSMPNQVSPYGTQTSVQTGTRTIPAVTKVNKKGKTVVIVPEQQVPVYTQTTTLSPAEQQKLDLQNQFGIKSGQIGNEQLGRLSDVLSSPLDLSTETTGAYLMDLARKRLDPIWNDRQQSLETELRNQGVQPGTKAYDAAMANFDYGRNDAYNQMLLQGHQQGVQERVLARQEPINESLGLATGIPLNMPQFANIGGPTVAGVDYAAQNYNNAVQKNAKYNAMLGGLFDLGGATIQAVGPQALRSMGSGQGGQQPAGPPGGAGPGGWSYY